MTLATLKAIVSDTVNDFGEDAAFMEAYKPHYNAKSHSWAPAVSIADIWRTEALSQLNISLDSLGIAPSPIGTYFDSLITDRESYWRRVLALKQLVIAYRDQDQGEGSLNRERLHQLEREYDNAIGAVHGLIQGRGTRQSRQITFRL